MDFLEIPRGDSTLLHTSIILRWSKEDFVPFVDGGSVGESTVDVAEGGTIYAIEEEVSDQELRDHFVECTLGVKEQEEDGLVRVVQ